MRKVIFAFSSGKILHLRTECESVEEYFCTNQYEDGSVPAWLVSREGFAVNTNNVDWICVEREDE